MDVGESKQLRCRAVFTLAVVLGGCGEDSGNEPVEQAHAAAQPGEPVHWSYEGAEGPEHWGELDAAFAACGNGKHQSPVEFPESIAPGPLSALAFDYAAAAATIVDNGHTIQVGLAPGADVLNIGGEQFTLEQFHFHHPSEHTFDGEHKPLEAHLVHRSADGTLAVVGVAFDVGEANVALAPVFDSMSSASDEPLALSAAIDPSALLPVDHSGWVYSGSLTTPPCSEGVRWHVFADTLEVSDAQVGAFVARHDPTARPVQSGEILISGGN